METAEELKKSLPEIQFNVSLKEYTTFRIGGPALYFFKAKNNEDVRAALEAVQSFNLPLFVLSGGSNVLVSEHGFPGFVLYMQNSEYRIEGTTLFAEAGVEVDALVTQTTRRGLAGLEWAGGLPGTFGGAVRGNAGAFGGEIKDILLQVEAIDEDKNIRTFSNAECEFSYRSSIFKEKNLTVLSASFALVLGDKEEIQGIAQDHIRHRLEKHPLEYPNAGSIFKNCDLKKFSKDQQEQMKDVVKVDPFPVIPTAYLIAQAELQGLRIGDAEVSKKHPNYIINRGNATSYDVLRLIAKVKAVIQEKFHIELEEEITVITT